MFSTVLNGIASYLDKRFILSIFLPSLVFWALVGGLVTIARGSAETVKVWSSQPAEVQVFLLILFMAWVTFFAYLLANHLTSLTRLYEGYWDWIPKHQLFAEPRRRHYQTRLADLQETLENLGEQSRNLEHRLAGQQQRPKSERAEADQEIEAELKKIESDRQSRFMEMYSYFPPHTRPEAIMPTRLGNIFKSAELYPYLRYRIDAVLIWPRLYVLLPQTFSEALANIKSSLDLMLIVSFLSCWLAPIGLACWVSFSLGWVLSLLTFLGGLLVSWLAYRGAVKAAVAYGELIRAAFDLHRGTVIRALGLKTPTSLAEEHILWNNINTYLYRGFLKKQEAFQYASPSTPEDDTTE
jgi:hypothetical protein